MPDISLKITRQDDGQFIIERNSQSPEKVGKDWSVVQSQLSSAFGQFMEQDKRQQEERKFAPKQTDLPDDTDTTPTSKSEPHKPVAKHSKAA